MFPLNHTGVAALSPPRCLLGDNIVRVTDINQMVTCAENEVGIADKIKLQQQQQ